MKQVLNLLPFLFFQNLLADLNDLSFMLYIGKRNDISLPLGHIVLARVSRVSYYKQQEHQFEESLMKENTVLIIKNNEKERKSLLSTLVLLVQ